MTTFQTRNNVAITTREIGGEKQYQIIGRAADVDAQVAELQLVYAPDCYAVQQVTRRTHEEIDTVTAIVTRRANN